MTYTESRYENETLPDGYSVDTAADLDIYEATGFDSEATLLATEAAFALSTDTWTDEALCRNTPGSADLFFSEELTEIAAAKQICAACPVMAECLEGALDRGEPCGVWGGQLFVNGQVVARKRRRGRPPKVARPEDQLPTVEVPAHLRGRVARQLEAAAS